MLAAGFTRRKVYCKAGVEEFDVEIRTGTFEEAWLYAWASNLQHGQRYTNKDKRHGVKTACLMWRTDSVRTIADRLKVSHELVRTVREELMLAGKLAPAADTIGADGKTYRKSQAKAQVSTVDTYNGGKNDRDNNPVGTVQTSPAAAPKRSYTGPADRDESEPLYTADLPSHQPPPWLTNHNLLRPHPLRQCSLVRL